MSKVMNAGVHRPSVETIWHESGASPGSGHQSRARLLRLHPHGDSSILEPQAHTSWLLRRLCRATNRTIAASSLAPRGPLIDVREFAWTATLRREWRAIRDEARDAGWRDQMLWQGGLPASDLADRCPVTARTLSGIPGLHNAAFAALPAGVHVPVRHGLTKALITCHLGLAVPRDGDARMRLRDRVVRWAEGETLLFDDSYDHALWNDGSAPRVVLHLQFARPLRQPGLGLATLILRALRHAAPPLARVSPL
ncbi:aspartyl/asparaginyl beta-hydroxylase domain-containing protein [Sphingomonadaceae bacterium jetA1]|jgi:beta-hydroxylase|uniref:aspartyl/asparaginyl beta-hydroxylase domain-containing protein n=1 Tax=Facivitalis istanbulensis TaxID=3075838 RepID=UPI003471025D